MRVSLLKEKNFGLLMLGKLVSLVGTQMQNFALSLYVFKITGSAAKFATVLMVTIIPQLILGPMAGVFVDWLDRKKIIVYLDMANGILIGIYAILFYINGELSLGSIYIFAILLSLISVLFQPAISTVIPSIVKNEELVEANSINSLIMNAGNLISPMIAGALFGVCGLFIILVINSISFILSSISEMFIDIPKVNKKPEVINLKSFNKDFKEGIMFIKNSKILFSVICIAVLVNFGGAPLSIGLIYISKSVLKISDIQYGMLETFATSAMIVSPFLCSFIGKKFEFNKVLFGGLLSIGFFIALMSIIPYEPYLNLFDSSLVPYISLIIAEFVLVMAMGVVNISISIMFQQIVPLDMMGRVGTVMNTGCMASMPLAQLIFGLLYDNIPTTICVLISAIIIIITMMVFKKSLLATSLKEKESISLA